MSVNTLLKLPEWLICQSIRLSHWSSKELRNSFITYFKSKDHLFIRPSSVMPLNDPSLAFVNAGMNQFKPIFLGKKDKPCKRAVNSQKCIRVGGKHNDLNDVGKDGRHHTFFEMLGTWSFGDYFKNEACEMAWDILTNVYKIPADNLYVTYFRGDEQLKLQPDIEAYEIWRKLGVSGSHILAYGTSENFWEMGNVGPCGPCTEILYSNPQINGEEFLELWNIVFMENERLENGDIVKLDERHIDSGMGLERLLSVLNRQNNNYGSDLFEPVFNEITKLSRMPSYEGKSYNEASLDYGYRVLADHSRMMTACIADGFFPDDNYKLRRIIQRSLSIGWEKFNLLSNEKWLAKLASIVASILGETYPEMTRGISKIKTILDFEEDHFLSHRDKVDKNWKLLISDWPEISSLSYFSSHSFTEGLKEAYPYFIDAKTKKSDIPIDIICKLNATYGIDFDIIEDIFNLSGIVLDTNTFESAKKKLHINLENYQDCHKDDCFSDYVIKDKITPTNCEAIYLYTCDGYGNYGFEPLISKVIAIMNANNSSNPDFESESVGVILKDTNFYFTSGGQQCDTGYITSHNGHFLVSRVESVNGTVIHWGTHLSGQLKCNDKVECLINTDNRLSCMRHHTATHLLNCLINNLVGPSYQTSSFISPSLLLLESRSFLPVTDNIVEEIEIYINNVIKKGSKVNRNIVALNNVLHNPSLQIIPNEIYPEDVSLISAEVETTCQRLLTSVEPCCGTHVLDISHIGKFVVISLNSKKKGKIFSVKAACGNRAEEVLLQGKKLLSQLNVLKEEYDNLVSSLSCSSKKLNSYKSKLKIWKASLDASFIPYMTRVKMLPVIEDIQKSLRSLLHKMDDDEMLAEMKKMIKDNENPVVHFLKTDFGTKKPHLTKATNLCKNVSCIVFAWSNSTIVAQCCVHEDFIEKGVSATNWLTYVMKQEKGKIFTPHPHCPHFLSNFKGNESSLKQNEENEQIFITRAKMYIDNLI